MVASDVVYVPVLPAFRDFDAKLAAQSKASGESAGKIAGQGYATGLESARGAVSAASAKLAAARDKEADAAGKIKVAEAQLQAMRDKGVTDVGRLTAAEERVAKARRDSATASDKTKAAASALATAESTAANAAKNLGSESASASGKVKELGSSTEDAGSSLGRFGTIAAAGAGLAILGKLAMDAGKAFLDVGETFANVNKTLQFTTGATGAELDSMTESVKNIGKASPKSLGEISTVLAKLSQRTGLTGADLELLTKQVIKTNAVMGQDTDINGLTQAFAAFGIQGADTSAAMDELFKASRATGVSVNDLAAQAVKGAPQFQQFGMSIGESAALMGSLDKAGINSDAVLTGLNKAMVAFAKDGRAPKEALHETIGAIEDFTAAGNDAAAIEMAAKLFGTKGAGQFVNAVKSGAVSVEQLTSAMDDSQKGVMEAGGAIPTLSSAWAMFKNNVIIALEPVATRVFGIFIDGLTWFRTTGVQAIQTVVAAFQGLLSNGPLSGVVDFFLRIKDGAVGLFDLFVNGNFGSALAAAFNVEEDAPLVGQLFDIRDKAIAVFNEVKGGITAFIAAFKDGGDDITSSGFAGFLEGLGVQARNLYDTWNTTILPALQTVGGVIVDVGSAALPVLWSAFQTGVDVVGSVSSVIAGLIGWMNDHRVVVGVLAGIILVGLIPAFVAWTVSMVATGVVMLATAALSLISATQTVAAWVMAQLAAVKSAAIQVASAYRVVGGWVLTGATAVAQAAIAAGAWVASSARTVAALALQGGAFVAQRAVMVAGAAATGIATAAQWAFNLALSANPITLIIIGITALVGALVWFFTQTEIGKTIITAAWSGIQAAISAVWGFLQGMFASFVQGFRDIGAGAMWLWNNAILPAFDGIKAAISFAWSLVEGYFNLWKMAFSAIGDAAMWLYSNAIQPAFDGVGAVISAVLGGAQAGFDIFMTALGKVGEFVGTVVSGIGAAWEGMKSLLAKPINFLINTVWNDGILKAWNAVADFLPGLEPASPLAGIPEHATGGAINGPGGIDNVLMWGTRDEHMLTVDEVAKAGGHGAVYTIRDMIARGVPFSWDNGRIINDLGRKNVAAYGNEVRSVGVGNGDPQGMFDRFLPKYKDGGPIEPWHKQLENGHRAAKMRNGNPYTWGFEDCSGYMSMIADAIINGGNGVRKWATGSFPGGQPWERGLGAGFSVGVHHNPGGPGGGHTAGTLSAVGAFSTVNVESGGSHGNVAYGGPAAGADSSQFVGVSPGQFHLGIGANGFFQPAGPGGGSVGPSPAEQESFLQDKINDIFDAIVAPIRMGIVGAIGAPPPEYLGIPPKYLDTGVDLTSDFLGETVGGLGDALSSVWQGAQSLVGSVFDDGGRASGRGMLFKDVIRPERVLDPRQTEAFESWLDSGSQTADLASMVDKLDSVSTRQEAVMSQIGTPASPSDTAEKVESRVSGGIHIDRIDTTDPSAIANELRRVQRMEERMAGL